MTHTPRYEAVQKSHAFTDRYESKKKREKFLTQTGVTTMIRAANQHGPRNLLSFLLLLKSVSLIN